MLIEVLAERSHHAWSVHLEGVREGSAVADESSVSNQHQGDKVHRTVRRLLFVTRATGAARDEQLGEHKTPSRHRDGKIREQRPEALDVLGAGFREHG